MADHGAATIQCEDCGNTTKAYMKNMKRCPTCRLIKNLLWMHDRKLNCWLCKTRFAPVSRDDVLCGKCAFKRQDAEQVLCSFCKETRTSIAQNIGVCIACARVPKNRKQFLRLLVERQERLRVKPHPLPPEPEPPEPEPVWVV